MNLRYSTTKFGKILRAIIVPPWGLEIESPLWVPLSGKEFFLGTVPVVGTQRRGRLLGPECE